MRHAALIGVLCTVFVTACSEETGPNISGIEDIDITRVEVSPKLDTLFVADTLRPTDRLQMAAAVIGRTGTAIGGAKVAWSSSKPEVATVTENGMVVPTGYGTTVITASAAEVAKATIVVMPAARSVVITPAIDTIFVEDPIALRDSIRLTAKAIDENGDVIAGVAFTWSSALAATATVNVAGSVTARSLGVVNVSATSGTHTGAASVRVASAVKAIQVAAPVTTVLAKDTLQMTATALGYDDKPMGGRTFTWTSSNPTVATVDANGRAIFLRAGNVTFTAKSAFTTSQLVVNALERQFQRLSAGDDFSCGFTNLGRGYCWGVGDFGQLATAADSSCFDAQPPAPSLRGGGTFQCTLAPKRFAGPALEFTAMDAGGSSACGISKERKLYCWGDDAAGQIGNGGGGGAAVPTLATVAQERFDSITVGDAHACALNIAGLAYCWGDDAFGQLGDERTVNSTTPIPVIGGLTFTAISAGGSHTCGLSNGQAYCWGRNNRGQLGRGFVGDPEESPVLVSGGGAYRAISAGANHTCALSTDGKVVCWGANDLAQLGGGSASSDNPNPVSVGSGTFAQISAGASHTCAMTGAGAVSCWGWNDWAQLGNGSVGGNQSVSQVQSTLVFRSITAGTNHTCGLANDGESYCWGSNVFGSLGNELQAAYRQTPQRVAAPR
jgi:alpha-tubulin suppressor-like RCC1 family protein